MLTPYPRGLAPPGVPVAGECWHNIGGVIERIVPADVVAVEAFEDPDGVELFAEESALVAASVRRRQVEFATVRHCARAALARLGLPAVPILPGPRGAPVWPAGVIGSMTHCHGYRAAALARSGVLAAIGVDAEPHETLPDGVLGMVAFGPEQAQLRELAVAEPGICWDRLLFSAKEAVYKAWFPLTGRWLDFAEAQVCFDAARHAFTARFLVPGPDLAGRRLTEFTGRFLAADGLVLTTVCVHAGPAAAAHS